MPSWFALLPPLCVLIAACVLKQINRALAIGLVSAAIVAAQFSPLGSITILGQRLYGQITDIENIYLYSFLAILGFITTLLEHSGGAQAFAQALSKRLKSAKKAQLGSIAVSLSFFIDDYLNCLTVSYIMRPITDSFNIARVKLAYLIHSLTSPLVMIAPISTWIAMITSQLDQAGINAEPMATTKIIEDPFIMYLSSIPFVFYSILTVCALLIIVVFSISYGPMKEEEDIAAQTGNLVGGKEPLIIQSTAPLATEPTGSIWDLIAPILVLIGSFLIGLLFMGNFWLFGGTNGFMLAIQKTQDTSLVLLLSSIICLTFTIAMGLIKNTITLFKVPQLGKESFLMMYSSLLTVFLASTFGLMLRVDLGTGSYLANLLLGALAPFLLPLAFFIVSLTVSLITGSAWGTIAIMVPIGVQMLFSFMGMSNAVPADQLTLIYPLLGAIFSGAVCGNHISPVAELTVMVSNSIGCYPLAHAYTQIWYAIPVIIAAALSYLLAGLLNSWGYYAMFIIALAAGIGACLAQFAAITIWQKLWRKP